MRGASTSYKELMQQVLKPATQIRFREAVEQGYIALGSNDNIDMTIVKSWSTPDIPNYRRYATVDNFGWKVDDDSYICVTRNAPITNNMFITKELTANTDVTIQDNMGVLASQVGDVYLKIAPIHCSSLTIKFGKTDHHGGFVDTPQEVTIDGTSMTDFETVHFTVEEDMYLLKFNVSEDCRISYYPLSNNAADPVAIFVNSNLISVDIEESSNLYSQELPRFDVTVKIYDADGTYDPVNPQGEFAKFVQDYSVYMLMGYMVEGYLETPFTVLLYLKDTPVYENHEITLSFSTTKSADNKYIDTLPIISGNPGDPIVNRTYRHTAGSLTIDSNGFESLITRAEMDQIICSIYGLGYVNPPKSINLTRALYNYVRLHHFTGYEIINKNSIKIDRKPILKALTIKQYSNTIPTTYQETVSGSAPNSNVEHWTDVGFYQYRMIIDVDADVSDICKVDVLRLVVPGSSANMVDFSTYTDSESGATHLRFWVYCDEDYNPSGTTTYTLGLYHVRQVTNDITESVNPDGENMVIDNPFITNTSLLESCRTMVKNVAYYRDYYTFDAIADYLTDANDWIVIDTPYEKNVGLFVTDIKYHFPGGTCTITGNRRFCLSNSNYSTDVARFAHINGVEYICVSSFALVGYFHTTGGDTDVVVVSASNGTNAARIQAPVIGYDTNNDGNVISITDSTSLTWYCDVADHSISGEYYADDCMYLGRFANVEAAARYLIVKAYADQGFIVTLEV